MQILLELRNVTKSFGGVRAVNGVSLSLQEGSRNVVIGPNGAGKSTLFNLICGLFRCDSGEIYFHGQPIHRRSPQAICSSGIARTFQISSVFPRLTVLENIQVAWWAHQRQSAQLLPRKKQEASEICYGFLRDVDLHDAAAQIAGTLSYGDQKRIELAMALSLEPRLLLLDEPMAGVATRERRLMVELINRLCREKNITLLFTEHDMEIVSAAADRVAVLDNGRLIAEGSPEEVKANQEVRRVYLGEE